MIRFHSGLKQIVLFLSLLLSGTCFSQDLIVTQTSDSINCYITKEKAGYVYFIVNSRDSTTNVINSLLPLTQIKSIQRNYYGQAASVLSPEETKKMNFPRVRFGIIGGYSRRLAGNPDGVSDDYLNYLNALRNGFTFGSDFTYFLNVHSGIGVKYSIFKSKAEGQNLPVEMDDGSVVLTDLRDDISIQYFGLTYTARFISKKNENAFFLRCGIGYEPYKDNFLFMEPFEITANTAGISLEAGYDFSINDNVAVSLIGGFTTGYYEKFTITNSAGNSLTGSYDEMAGDNLVRFDLTLGFSLR